MDASGNPCRNPGNPSGNPWTIKGFEAEGRIQSGSNAGLARLRIPLEIGKYGVYTSCTATLEVQLWQ